MNYNSIDDGVTHINVYSKGLTELGRLLSNFAFIPIDTEDGLFNSIEAYWYWLNIDDSIDKDYLREQHGYNAKRIGRILRNDHPNTKITLEEFKRKIKLATKIKINSSQSIINLMTNTSILPLTHYYVNSNGTITNAISSCKWQIEYIEFIFNTYSNDIYLL